MDSQDPLAQLRDIHLPDGIGVWPPAPGWWLLGILLIGALVALIVWRYRYFLANRYRNEAAMALQSAWQQCLQSKNRDLYLIQLTQILKRTALTAYPNIMINRLHGQDWLRFLGDSLPDKSTQFTEGPGRQLLDLPYRPLPKNVNLKPLHQLCLQWLREHRQQRSVIGFKRQFKLSTNAQSSNGLGNAAT